LFHLGKEDSIQLTLEINDNVTASEVPFTIQDKLNQAWSPNDNSSAKFVYRSHVVKSMDNSKFKVECWLSLQDEDKSFVEGLKLSKALQSIQLSSLTTSDFGILSSSYVEAPKSYLKPGSAGVIALYIFDGIGIAGTLVTATLVWIHRNKKSIKNILPRVSILMMLGLLLVQVGVLLFIDVPSESSCVSRKVLIDIGFVIFFGLVVSFYYD
jgi:hypothetical protein